MDDHLQLYTSEHYNATSDADNTTLAPTNMDNTTPSTITSADNTPFDTRPSNKTVFDVTPADIGWESSDSEREASELTGDHHYEHLRPEDSDKKPDDLQESVGHSRTPAKDGKFYCHTVRCV